MHITRRHILAGLGATVAMPHAGPAGTLAETEWLSAGETAGRFAPLVLGGDGDAQALGYSEVRLHAIEPCPVGPLAVAVARRPGTVAIVVDRRQKKAVGQFAPEAGRVFSGHGRFTADGTHFLVAEIERASGRGIVTLRHVADAFSIVAAWPTDGTGPHDLIQAGDMLVVANGGIEPGSAEAMEAEDAEASIALLDARTGSLRSRLEPAGELRGQSLRHLARGRDGALVVAAQELTPEGADRPLVYRIGDNALVPFEAPAAALAGLKGYVGSVAIDRGGRFVAASSPRGGRILVWSMAGRYVGELALIDGCGLAPTPQAGSFVATSGLGDVVGFDVSDEGVAIVSRRSGGPRFDNHVSLAG